MPDPNIIGTPNDVIWGTNSIYSGKRIVTARASTPAEEDLSLDNNGIATGSIDIPGVIRKEFEMECQSSITLPNLHENINVFGSFGHYVENIEEIWNRKGRKIARVQVKKFPS